MYTISKQYKHFLESIGVSSEKLYKKLNLPTNATKDIVVSKEKFIEFMTSLEDFTDYEKLVTSCSPKIIAEFIPPIYAALCSQNGYQALKRISTYKKLIGPMVLRLEEDEEKVTCYFCLEDNSQLPKISEITENALLVNLIRTGTGMHINPLEIKSKVDYSEGLSDFFGVNPIRSANNNISFRTTDLLEVFITENNIMWSYLQPEFNRRIEEMEVDTSLSAKVRSLLFELIPAGSGNIEKLAFELNLSPRTLQRKLSDENTTFLKQLNHTKELLAKTYLKNEELEIVEVAYLLGYSESSAFMRAFQTWTGMTVGNYRKYINQTK